VVLKEVEAEVALVLEKENHQQRNLAQSRGQGLLKNILHVKGVLEILWMVKDVKTLPVVK
jgi:hypothetical protein